MMVEWSARILRLRTRFLSAPAYWRARRRLTRVRAQSALAATRTRTEIAEWRTMGWLLVTSFGRVIAMVVTPVTLVVCTQSLGTVLAALAVRWPWLPGWLSTAMTWLGKGPSIASYQPVVGPALSVAGLLAGAYFATVTFVMSTTYKDATAGVRALVTRLPAGRMYTLLFIQVVLFGLVLLALPMIGRVPNWCSLSVLAALGAVFLLSFGRLRNQLFGLLEPVRLLAVVHDDLRRLITQASKQTGTDSSGLRARTAGARTEQSLRLLRDLCHLIREREHSRDDVPAEYAGVDPRTVSAARTVVRVWLLYAQRKHLLTMRPGWSPPSGRHQDWLLAADHELSIALGTSTALYTDQTTDPLWLERHLARSLAELLAGRDVPRLASILVEVDDPVRMLMAAGMFAEAQLWMETIVVPARTASSSALEGTSQNATSEGSGDGLTKPDTSAWYSHVHNLVDLVGLAYVNSVLGLRDYAHQLTVEFPHWMIDQALGRHPRRLGPAPVKLLTNVGDALRFEQTVERRRITSHNNIAQLVALAIATETFDEVTALMSRLEDELWPWADRLAAGHTWPAGAALGRVYESLNKFTLLLESASRLFELCQTVHRDVDDRWPDLDVRDLQSRRNALRARLRIPTVALAASVDAVMTPGRPDVFGWAFQRGHQDLLDDVLAEQPSPANQTLQRLRHLLTATDRATERLQTTVHRQHYSVLNSVWSEPMLMLMQVSGIALIMARLDPAHPAFQPFATVWGELLDADARHTLGVALGASISDDGYFALSPGKISRTGRQQQTLAVLRERASLTHGGRSGLAATPVADDRFVAIMRHIGYNEFEDVFIAAWLIPEARRRGAVPEDELGPKLSSLIDALANSAGDERDRTKSGHEEEQDPQP